MGFISKVAVIGAVAALAVNRSAVKKAFLGLIDGDGPKALAPAVKKAKGKAKTGTKKVRTATRKAPARPAT